MKNKAFVFNLFFLGIFFSTLIYSPFILDFTLVPRLISISIILFATVLLLKRKDFNDIKFDIISLSYIAFVVFSCASYYWANTKTEALFENSKLLVAISVFFISYHFFKINKDGSLNLLCKLSVLIFFIELVYIISQITHVNIFNKEELYSVFGLNSHKNLLASFLLINLFFLILAIIKLKGVWKVLSIISLAISLFVIVIIQTKAVWIAFVISIVSFFILFYYKRIHFKMNIKWSISIVVIFFNVFFIFVQPQIIKKALHFNISQKTSSKAELDNERLMLWEKTYKMIEKYSVIGVGSGNWQIYFPDATLNGMYRAEDLNYTFQRPHNDVLWIISETGFIGFNLFLLFVISILVFIVRTSKTIRDNRIVVLQLLLCFSVIVGFFTASFFDFPKERIEHLIWINIVFAYAYYLIKTNNLIRSVIQFKFFSLYFLVAAVCFFLISIIGVYRYKGEYYTRKMYDQKKMGNNIAVIQEGKKALNFGYSIDPTSLPIKWYTGNSYAVLGNYNQAKIDLLVALKLNPYNRNVLNDLASAYVSVNQIDSAKYYYLEACRISPRFDDPKLNLAALYFNERRFVSADSCLHLLVHDSERRAKYQSMVNAFLGK